MRYESGEKLTKKELKFLQKDIENRNKKSDEEDPNNKDGKKKKKKRRKKSSRHDTSSSDSDDTDDSEAERIKRKKRKENKKIRMAEKEAKKLEKKKYDSKYKPGESSRKMCEICFIEKCKYRCPKCRILYCVDEKAEFKCFREHNDKGMCEKRIAEGLHIKPLTKEDTMDIKEKLAIALKKRKKRMKELGQIK